MHIVLKETSSHCLSTIRAGLSLFL